MVRAMHLQVDSEQLHKVEMVFVFYLFNVEA